jgi:RHS repeat-associated protein
MAATVTYSCASGTVSGSTCAGAVRRTRYEAYGTTAAGHVPVQLGFTGHVNDADTGLVYMQQRYYDPIAARFLTVDPIVTDANAGTLFNRYEYGNNNPYRYTDPDGGAPADRFDADLGGSGAGGVGRMLDGTPVRMSLSNARQNLQAARAEAATKSEILKQNVERGRSGEAATRDRLGDSVAGEQVSFKTSDGTRARTDFVTKSKEVVETKTGEAKLSGGQEKLKADIDAGRAVTPVGQNAQKAGLSPGLPTTMKCCTVDRPNIEQKLN